MAVLCTQRRYSCTGNNKSKLSVWCWHHLEAWVQLHHLRGEVHLRAGCAGHPWSWSSWHLCACLSQSRCAWMRCVEVDGVDLGHAGCQMTQEASPDLWVHSFTRGQETGDFPDTLAESGSVFTQERWVSGHSSWGETSTVSVLLVKIQIFWNYEQVCEENDFKMGGKAYHYHIPAIWSLWRFLRCFTVISRMSAFSSLECLEL